MRIFPLLKSVARSFYLTIWWLPAPLREPVGLAYLLARASDTIADEESNSMTKPERELLKQLPSLIEQLNDPRRNRFEADAIKAVWKRIIEGQSMDLKHQTNQNFFSHQELEEYLYLVAGCVGEFWTKLAEYYLPHFSTKSLEKMESWGIDYGKGLQLVNILRDFSEDQRRGRFYFSAAEKNFYDEQALAYLQQGETYVNALRPGRFKMATALPLLLGRRTLALIKKQRNAEKLKIRRWVVWWTLLRALRFLFS